MQVNVDVDVGVGVGVGVGPLDCVRDTDPEGDRNDDRGDDHS